jgi:pantoate--beta-alanine ligase
MGALHRGHAALLRSSAAACELTVASVFVNPSQFDEPYDLAVYPRTPAADEKLLRRSGCDILYRPSVEDVYPNGTTESLTACLDFGQLVSRWEGEHRPGHFAGVAQVVSRLLDIVRPDLLFLGQKDYQQVAVIRRMIDLLGLTVGVRTIPTMREADGLALSSRNRRLSPEQRLAAGSINVHLAAMAAGVRADWPARELERIAFAAMRREPLLEPEYVAVVDGHSLAPYENEPRSDTVVVLTAVRVGEVRLIDNRIARAPNPKAGGRV